MFAITDCTILRDEEEFEISASINELLGNLEIDCNIPDDRKVSLELSAGGRRNLLDKKLYPSGSKVEIELQPLKSDSFTLEVSDENGNAMSSYRIMRSYC